MLMSTCLRHPTTYLGPLVALTMTGNERTRLLASHGLARKRICKTSDNELTFLLRQLFEHFSNNLQWREAVREGHNKFWLCFLLSWNLHLCHSILTWPTLCRAFRSFSDFSYCLVCSLSCSLTRKPNRNEKMHALNDTLLNSNTQESTRSETHTDNISYRWRER